ncbi:hypothetical protein UFOVP142_58 [uncultured Caudovirales phage]|uniref:Uncharacterized protein n=1 Tax=uncultured Caudovirales phage TaxID=2100421 RepID=A0A6J7XL44_9CAUD|nr:hypothetical protein UFOVP142_58 [uncultured Caudovirales phage]
MRLEATERAVKVAISHLSIEPDPLWVEDISRSLIESKLEELKKERANATAANTTH